MYELEIPWESSFWDTVSVTDIIVAFGGLVFLIVIFMFILKVVHPMMVKITRVLDEFLGRPAEQGIPEVPGVLKRLDNQDERLDKIEKQVTPNHGSTTKLSDAVIDLEAALKKLERRFNKHFGPDDEEEEEENGQ